MTATTAQSENDAAGAAGCIFKAMNAGDPSVLAPLLGDDVRFDFPGAGIVAGKKRVLVFLKALLRKYPDIAFTVTDVVAGPDTACVVWTNSARLDTDSPYRNSGVTIVHCPGGLITFISDYFKDTSFVTASAAGPGRSA